MSALGSLSVALLMLSITGCDDEAPADADADGDTDTESDGDRDSDSDSDGDTDSDVATDADTDGDTDADSDADGEVPTTDQITQYGVTWTFDEPRGFGQFANGDYWVLGPLTIVEVTPAFDGEHHGFEVNPSEVLAQGFDSRVADFDASRVPALPYEASPGESIVQAVSLEPLDDTDCRPCLQTAVVLTVVGAPPPDLGATVLRPPYFGAEKPSYSTEDLRDDLLPSLAQATSAPSLDEVVGWFQRVQLDHKTNWTGRAMHPADNMPDYGSDISVRSAEGALRLLLDDPLADRRQALIVYVQAGIDLYHMALGGQTWPPNGGHSEGRKLPIAFAALLLDDAEMQTFVRSAGGDVFGEDGGTYHSEVAGTVLYGQMSSGEEAYWTNLVFDSGSRTQSDPYGWIDGGYRPGDSYQFCCLSQPWKATATVLRHFPELLEVWNNQLFLDYVDRWVSLGAWAQPDPCAPPEGLCSGGDHAGALCTTASEPEVCTGGGTCDATASWDRAYGVTYGPDGTGGCIADPDASDGIGRFPQLHGAATDDGYYGSAFASELWDRL